MKVAVLGAGSWGTALAVLLSRKYPQLSLWARNPQTAQRIAADRVNVGYLPEVCLPKSILVTSSLEEAVAGAAMILLVTPSHVVRSVVRQIAPAMERNAVVVSAAKGIEVDTYRRMSEVIGEELPECRDRIAVLSGPNHAEEVGKGYPSATVVASCCRETAEFVQEALMSSYFRVYTNPDVIGVEIGGALKNIVAIDAGIADGLGFGDNSVAALMTRGLAEITRLGMAMGANPLTFAGLSGVGDLMVTCTSRHSRNRRAGMEIATGKTVEQVQAGTNMIVEGIRTTAAAYHLREQYQVEMPITEQTFLVLYKGKSPRRAVLDLMTRGKKHEVEEVVVNCFTWQK